jgi:hypothetical protein
MSDLAALGISFKPRGPVEQRVPCPRCGEGHGARDDALGVNVDTGVFHCFRCGWKGCANTNTNTSAPQPVRIDDPGVAERKRERLRATWRETLSLEHPKAHAVRAYLKARGLGAILISPPQGLRAHPGLEYWEGARLLGAFPAMIALFHNPGGKVVTLHCTYLRADGNTKAAVPAPKKILGVPVKGATRGGAVRLYPVRQGGALGVCEGIETALSMRLIRKIPVWASFCADNLAHLMLPEGLRKLEIGVDLDPSGKGEAVADALARRVRRWSPRTRVTFIKPDLSGPGDLNDELRRRAGKAC